MDRLCNARDAHLAHGASSKKNGKRRLALHGTFYRGHFSFAGEESGQAGECVLRPELRAFSVLIDFFSRLLKQPPRLGERAHGFRGL